MKQTNNRLAKVLSSKFQPTPPKRKSSRPSETSCDDDADHPHSLPARRSSSVVCAEKVVADIKSTISEPIKPGGKKTVGSVSF